MRCTWACWEGSRGCEGYCRCISGEIGMGRDWEGSREQGSKGATYILRAHRARRCTRPRPTLSRAPLHSAVPSHPVMRYAIFIQQDRPRRQYMRFPRSDEQYTHASKEPYNVACQCGTKDHTARYGLAVKRAGEREGERGGKEDGDDVGEGLARLERRGSGWGGGGRPAGEDVCSGEKEGGGRRG